MQRGGPARIVDQSVGIRGTWEPSRYPDEERKPLREFRSRPALASSAGIPLRACEVATAIRGALFFGYFALGRAKEITGTGAALRHSATSRH